MEGVSLPGKQVGGTGSPLGLAISRERHQERNHGAAGQEGTGRNPEAAQLGAVGGPPVAPLLEDLWDTGPPQVAAPELASLALGLSMCPLMSGLHGDLVRTGVLGGRSKAAGGGGRG